MTETDYELYPAHRKRLPGDVFDRLAYNERLTRDAGRLFSKSDIDISVTSRDEETGNVSTIRIERSSDLDYFLKHSCDNGAKELCFVFKQCDSWSHILSTISATKKLLAYFNVFPRFLDYLHSFGLRHSAIGEGLPTISLQSASPPNNFLEMCFDVRYPEENGRCRGDPWSIRHTALYYQRDFAKGESITILIQPSKRFDGQVSSLLTSDAVTGCRSLLLQQALFISSGLSWQDYVVSLEEELRVFEEKAFYSKVGVIAQHDYNLMFKDYQNLQRLRKKLLKGQALLGANIQVCKGYKSSKLAKLDLASGALDWYTFQLNIDRQMMFRLLKTADGVGETLLCILKYRSDEVANATTNAIHETGRILTELVTLSNANTEAVSKLTMKAQKDTRSTKVLTFVASLYLPATLVASIFNSNLVGPTGSRSGDGESAGDRHLAAARDFWMFPVFTAALTALTLSFIWLYTRRHTSERYQEIGG